MAESSTREVAGNRMHFWKGYFLDQLRACRDHFGDYLVVDKPRSPISTQHMAHCSQMFG